MKKATRRPGQRLRLGGERWRTFAIAEVRERRFNAAGIRWLKDEDLESSDGLRLRSGDLVRVGGEQNFRGKQRFLEIVARHGAERRLSLFVLRAEDRLMKQCPLSSESRSSANDNPRVVRPGGLCESRTQGYLMTAVSETQRQGART